MVKSGSIIGLENFGQPNQEALFGQMVSSALRFSCLL